MLLLRSGVGVFGAERVVLELAKGWWTEYHPFVGVIKIKTKILPNWRKRQNAGVPFAIVFECGGAFDVGTIRTIRDLLRITKFAWSKSARIQSQFYGLAEGVNKLPSLATIHPWTQNTHFDSRKNLRFWIKPGFRLVDERLPFPKMCRKFSKMLPQNNALISNGIDVQRFQQVTPGSGAVSQTIGCRGKRLLIGTIGRLVPEKKAINILSKVRRRCRRNCQILNLR